jgi:hypothetical protein
MVDVRVAEPSAHWRLITDSRVGVLTVAGWDVRIKPKLAIPRVMFLLGFAADPHDGASSDRCTTLGATCSRRSPTASRPKLSARSHRHHFAATSSWMNAS